MPTPESLVADVRHGVLSLVRDKGFTATALLIFGLCFGANVALFSVVNAVLLRPLPFDHPEELVTVFNNYPKAGVDHAGSSVPHYLERRAGIAAFADAAAVRDGGATIGEGAAPERVDALRVTPSFFKVLRLSPAQGRAFAEDEAVTGHENVVIISDELWRSRFAAAADVVGRSLRIDGAPATIIGVMAPGFRYLGSRAQLWQPLVFTDHDRNPEQRHSNNMSVIARLRPGATLAAAQSQVDALNQSSAASDPYAKLAADAGFYAKVVDLHADRVAKTRPMVLMLQAGVLLLLLIGLVNLTNLLLVRATARAKELSLRQVLGATSLQLGRQLIAETTLLSLCGALVGLALGWAGVRGIAALGADQLPHVGELRIDVTVVAVAIAVALVLGLVLAAPVLWQLRSANLAAALAVQSRGGTTSRSTHRLRHGLIAAQIALAFVLLVSAGLLGLSFARVLAVDPGFRADHVLTAAVPLPRGQFNDDKQRIAFVERLGRELGSTPGVSAVGFGSLLPFAGDTDVNAVTVEGHTPAPGESLKAHYMGGVTGDYFRALGIPLREGRFLTDDDTARAARVCVVDEIVSRHYWPQGGALGGRLYNGVPKEGEEPFTVVGVVGTIKQDDLADRRGTGAVYLPYAQYASRDIAIAVRTVAEPSAFATTLRAAVMRINADLAVTDVKPLASRIEDSLEQRRSPFLLALVFSGLALVLVAVGLYGVLAYAVSQRRREIGVRMALGAAPRQIRTQFLGLGARLALIGALVGAVSAWWSGRALTGLLFGVSAQQPAIFVGTAIALCAVALFACFVPAVRAARVPPMEALRGE